MRKKPYYPKKTLRVLVTGVGGDLGQSIVKALRLNSRRIICYGCDCDGTIGGAFVDRFQEISPAKNSSYLPSLKKMCRRFQIDAIIPGSEPELRVLSRAAHNNRVGTAPLIMQSRNFIQTYGDKLHCFKSLDGKIALAPFADGKDKRAVDELVSAAGFPVIVKERVSSGSRGLGLAKDSKSLRSLVSTFDRPVVQAYIDEKNGEFSVGLFSCSDFLKGIAFRRRFGPGGGCSWYAETVCDNEVLDYAYSVARNISFVGSINVQVRKSSRGVRLLEINPRFSSLVAARAACGFHDAAWSVELALGEFSNSIIPPFKMIRFRRYFGELLDFGNGFERLNEWDAFSNKKI